MRIEKEEEKEGIVGLDGTIWKWNEEKKRSKRE